MIYHFNFFFFFTYDYFILSNGLLNPPFLFIYCRYLNTGVFCDIPSTLSSTFLSFVVSNATGNPIAAIIASSDPSGY